MLAQVGVMLLMFGIGLEFDFGHLLERGNRRAVLAPAAFAGANGGGLSTSRTLARP